MTIITIALVAYLLFLFCLQIGSISNKKFQVDLLKFLWSRPRLTFVAALLAGVALVWGCIAVSPWLLLAWAVLTALEGWAGLKRGVLWQLL